MIKVFFENRLFLLFLPFILFLSSLVSSQNEFPPNPNYLIFPLHIFPADCYLFDKESTPESLMSQLYFKELYTYLEIGSPAEKVPALISVNYNEYYISSPIFSEADNRITENLLYNFTKFMNTHSEYSYFLNTSSTSYEYTYCWLKMSDYYREYTSYCNSNESISFFNSFDTSRSAIYQKKKTINKFFFDYVSNPREKMPAKIGLPQANTMSKYYQNFLTMLKKYSLINRYLFYIKFEKGVEGAKLFIGNYPHEMFPSEYKKENLIFVNHFVQYDAPNGENWKLNFSSVKSGNHSFSRTLSEFNYFSDLILAPYELKDYFNEKILEQKIKEGKCFSGSFTFDYMRKYNYNFFYCLKEEKNNLVKILPELKFYHKEFNYTFIIEKEDLFKEEGDFIYLLLGFGGVGLDSYSWRLGRPFTRKYLFVYDHDNTRIGFYVPPPKVEKKSFRRLLIDFFTGRIFITLILVVIAGILGVILGKVIYSARKKRANELADDDYDYTINDNTGKPVNYNE